MQPAPRVDWTEGWPKMAVGEILEAVLGWRALMLHDRGVPIIGGVVKIECLKPHLFFFHVVLPLT